WSTASRTRCRSVSRSSSTSAGRSSDERRLDGAHQGAEPPALPAAGAGNMTGLLTLAAEFNPADEFKLDQWVSIHLGPIDMSINKAVVYLAISALVTIFIGVFTMRSRLALLPSK